MEKLTGKLTPHRLRIMAVGCAPLVRNIDIRIDATMVRTLVHTLRPYFAAAFTCSSTSDASRLSASSTDISPATA